MSAPKNDVIPLTLICSSTDHTWSERTVVIAVATTGDWITLSIDKIALAFWLVDTNLWEVPIPTLVISNAIGILFNAFSAELASLILSSLIFIRNTSCGNFVVFRIPA